MKVFFRRLTLKNILKIVNFCWKRFVLHKPVPFSVVFAVTYKCQCGCVHCSINDYKKSAEELSTQEIKKAIDFIDQWGAVKITFFGGEPLVRKDVVELVQHASQKGIRTSLDTNGLLLDETMVVAIKRAGIGNINVSINSVDEAVHDFLRKKEGCSQAAINALSLCVRYHIPCLISTYASKRSIAAKDLEGIIKLAKNIKASGVKILFPILSGKWRDSESERLSLEEEAYVLSLLDPSFIYIEDALQMVKKRGKGCSALERNLVYFSPTGDVQPCPAIPVSFGNFREEPIEAIIARMERHMIFKKYHSCEKCLMNEPVFREKFFVAREGKELPVNADEFAV